MGGCWSRPSPPGPPCAPSDQLPSVLGAPYIAFDTSFIAFATQLSTAVAMSRSLGSICSQIVLLLVFLHLAGTDGQATTLPTAWTEGQANSYAVYGSSEARNAPVHRPTLPMRAVNALSAN